MKISLKGLFSLNRAGQQKRSWIACNFLILSSSFLFLAGLLLVSLVATVPAIAAGPEDDLAKANKEVQRAITAAQAGDLDSAQKGYKTYDDIWFEIEEGIKNKSREAYRSIEEKMSDVRVAFARTPPDSKEVLVALQALDTQQQNFIKGVPGAFGPTTPGQATSTTGASSPNSGATSSLSVATLLDQLTLARTALGKGDYTTAAKEIKEFGDTWPDVEGQVKARSTQAYQQTETDMALAAKFLDQKSPEARTVLDRMYTRLEPFKDTSTYGIFDAVIILLREGLEALLVVIALLTFLKKSGNQDKQPWVWGGAALGLAASVVLGIAIQILFATVINGSNRELLEGVTGLAAAIMLVYVSYWMHSKASAASWQRYIKQRSTAVLAKGSLFGLALLAFLAIFREGGETVLFFLGMGSAISMSDLLIGLAIGAVVLVVLGLLLTVAGLRIPIGPFFGVASILVFYLCFKFVGSGLHELQAAGLLSTTNAGYLPESEFLGLFPTWETTIPQLILLIAGLGVVIYGRLKSRSYLKIQTKKEA